MVSRVPMTIFLVTAVTAWGQVDANEFFEKRVRPVLTSRCSSCHITDQLRGFAAAGKLIPRITSTDPKVRMPANQPPLADQEIADLRDWVKSGASWPSASASGAKQHWAFQPLRKPTPPEVKT